MSKKLILLLLAAVCGAVPCSKAALKINMLTSADGLSNSSINCIYQDSTMMMWIGTWDGLNAYNGYGFKTYKFAPDNSNTISNNVIRNIVEEAEGIIWVATDYGINRIDVKNDRVERFYPGYEDDSPTAERVFSVAAADDGTVFCAATGWGIAWYDKALNRLSALNVPHFNSSEVRTVYYAGQNTLLLHTVDNGLVRVRYAMSDTGGIEVREKTDLFPGQVESLFDCRSAIYMVTADAVIYRYGRLDGGLTVLGKIPPPGHAVRAIVQYGDDHLLVASGSSDIYVYDMAGRTYWKMSQLPDINVLSFCYGSQDILWVGSDGQGVIQVYNDGIEFNKVPNSRMFEGRNCPVRAFCRDGRGNVYVATKGNGICMLNADGSKGAVYDVSRGLGNNFVYALAEGPCNDMFIGHDGEGLDVLSFATGRISTVKPVAGTYFGSVYAIYRDPSDGCVWLGTNGYGLIGLQLAESGGRYEIRRQNVYVNDKRDTTSLSNNTVFSIVPAGDGKLWVGTRGGGLNLFDTRSGRFTHYTTSSGDYPISSNDILSLYAGRDSTLWIGTSYGLNRLCRGRAGQDGFRWYVEKDGLPNNTIHGILEDGAGNLWLSTNKGLAQLNPADNRIISYYNNEELQSNEFSDGAYYRAADGRMYFGGVDGFNSFDPGDIRVRTYAPTVQLNNFLIKQTPMAGFRADREIVLSHSENFFSIQFSALEYIRNGNCEYAYILAGFNDDWVNIGTDNTAVFTNVPPGNYEFQVRCTNGDRIWGDNVTSLHIRVLPPWWNTVWAYLVYLLLCFVILYVVWFVVNDRIEQRRRLLMESMSKRQQTDNYEAKLRFFTSIAHEFCTPLTLIYGSGEQLLNSYHLTPDVAKHVRIVKNNAARMQRLIGELMEFRRVETGHCTPRYVLIDITELISTIADNFNEVNEQRRIDLRIDFPAQEVKVVSDRGALEKILYNLISNAYKYTPSDGYIDIKLRVADGRTTVRVTNSGKGIKPEDIGNVFNRFEILDNFERQANQGKVMRNGIGLALAQSMAHMLSGNISVSSKPGEYTTFTLSLPEVSRSLITEPEQDSVREYPLPDEDDAQAGPAVQSRSEGASILVVDDEKQIRDLIAEILSGEYTVIQAADGAEAIEILKHKRPDLIISDVSMPNVDGLELLKYLKSNEITKYIPFVFLSFKSDVEQEIRGYELGGDGYISKPFHPKHLLAVVHQILNNRISLRDYYNSVISSSDVYEGNTIDADDKKFIVQLAGIIEENMTDENLSLNFLCDKMCVSRMGLYRKIREITQMTPSEYIRSVKINHATHLLRTTNMTIQEIMYCSGFNNKSYFYREFAKIYHMSPKEMREKER